MRKLLVLAALALAPLSLGLSAAPVTAQTEAYAISTADLMRATALDQVDSHISASIASAPETQAMPFNATMNAAWDEASNEVFAADRMHSELATALDDKFSPEDYEVYAAFFASDFGTRVSEIERAITMLPPEASETARLHGLELIEGGSPRRHEQVEEMLKLVSADMTNAMVRSSVRGMLIGMSVTAQQGDITVPWEEIDAQLDAIMPGIEADIEITQRALMYFAYRDLTEADLNIYLEFLRTDAAQRFYAVAAYAVGEIMGERMETFGETLAHKLARVSV
jgi:hypothetical protein